MDNVYIPIDMIFGIKKDNCLKINLGLRTFHPFNYTVLFIKF